mmetsp:Transcript_29973/g.44045  ORF Transcript_29973/g.44045 Transcript_29973/m.44045 type:complete len:209 (-) Transcript_29973:1441-2067(-)|eukprot:CAMPEP_0116025000 /NCGR_PEP_ID=MMETSP0321-20121206/12727_1 /TAXON_ID=163516 /ORGANISM="Leptocylindrus danicus var. danicus, Strain B650" /LENGTH=208 /DNA_ID=CAMNT_0003496989 /DNA_START=42 /DNA_END=668 /DNA_ORIENTATION=-
MTSVVELFPKSRKLAYDARQQLSQVQNNIMQASELFLVLDELSRQLNIMDSLVDRETPAQREMWRRKIKELRDDAAAVRRQGQHYDRLMSAGFRQERERNELMARRRRRDAARENDESNLADESTSLDQSRIMMNDLLASGSASLNSLVEQRRRLKGAKRMVLDIGNRLGLSNSTMRMIEQRDATDFYIVIGGMAITVIVLYVCWFLF